MLEMQITWSYPWPPESEPAFNKTPADLYHPLMKGTLRWNTSEWEYCVPLVPALPVLVYTNWWHSKAALDIAEKEVFAFSLHHYFSAGPTIGIWERKIILFVWDLLTPAY